MTLTDYGITCDGPGGACRVVMTGHPVGDLEAEIAETRRRWDMRCGDPYAQGNMSFLMAKVAPLIPVIGIERAVDEFGPNAVGWATGVDPALLAISPVLWRWS